MGKENCWEMSGCGREIGGARVTELGVCPAAIDRTADKMNGGHNAGRICWAVCGTFCGGKKQGTFAQKRMSCMSCQIYTTIKSEEGNKFILLKPGQKYGQKAA